MIEVRRLSAMSARIGATHALILLMLTCDLAVAFVFLPCHRAPRLAAMMVQQSAAASGPADKLPSAEQPIAAQRLNDKLSIAIIGGGPAGLAAAMKALEIPEVGSVSIVEKSPRGDFQDGPGTHGIAIGPRAQRVLEGMRGNPMDRLDEVAVKYPGETNTSIIWSVNRAFIRESIFTCMEQEYGDSGRIHVIFNNTLSHVDTGNKKLHLRIGTHSGESHGVVDYDILVLADGVHSPCLELVNSPFLRSRKEAYWTVVKPMPAPPFPGDTMMKFSGKLQSDREMSAWLGSRKDGSRYMLAFWPHDEGKNPSEVKTAADVRKLLSTMNFTSGLGKNSKQQVSKEELAAYIESFSEETIEEWISRTPRHFWSSKCDQVVDERKGVALMGDAAGACLATLGHGAQRALVDAEDFSTSLDWALNNTRGGTKEDVIKMTLRLYGRKVLEERRSLTALNEFATVVRTLWKNDWRSKLYSKEISGWMADPRRSYKSIVNDIRVLPWLLLAKVPWKRRAISAEQVQEWRSGLEDKPG